MTDPTNYEIRTMTSVVTGSADHVVINVEANVLVLEQDEQLIACVPLQQLVYCIRTDD